MTPANFIILIYLLKAFSWAMLVISLTAPFLYLLETQFSGNDWPTTTVIFVGCGMTFVLSLNTLNKLKEFF